MQYTKPKDGKASEMMWDACTGGSSSWIHCGCGTAWEPEPIGDDESEEDYDDRRTWFRYVEVAGRTFVEECEECCKKLGSYEDWIWNNREVVRDYLSIRVNQEFKWAEQEKLLNQIAGIR